MCLIQRRTKTVGTVSSAFVKHVALCMRVKPLPVQPNSVSLLSDASPTEKALLRMGAAQCHVQTELLLAVKKQCLALEKMSQVVICAYLPRIGAAVPVIVKLLCTQAMHHPCDAQDIGQGGKELSKQELARAESAFLPGLVMYCLQCACAW